MGVLPSGKEAQAPGVTWHKVIYVSVQANCAGNAGTFPHDPERKWGVAGLLGVSPHLAEGLLPCPFGISRTVKHRSLSATAEPNSPCSETAYIQDHFGDLGVYSFFFQFSNNI